MFKKNITNFLLLGALNFIYIANGMTPSLSNFQYKCASVLPYTKFESGKKYFVLAREAFGSAQGTWDAFGGARDANEVHPVQTACREFCEESINLFNPQGGVEKYIDVDSGNTKQIIANNKCKSVVYFTYLSKEDARRISYGFQKARSNAKKFEFREKDAIAYVLWDDLEVAIANAPRNNQGSLILPIKVNAIVFDPTISKDPAKSKIKKLINLRPFFVSTVQPFFQNKNFTQGKHKAITFY